MNTYIAILRGINVSGQKKVLMTDLKLLCKELGFQNIVTYIQSGNIIFTVNKKTSNVQLEEIIHQAIEKKYGFDVPVIVRTTEEMKHLTKTNPFLKKKGLGVERLHVTFLAQVPAPAESKAITAYNYPPDEFVVAGKEVFLHCPVNYGETKLSNKFFESKLRVSATTRNWKTINKLAELSLSVNS